jgi:PAS domain S-box-containing protein
MGTGIDISSLKKAEEELRVSEQKYKLLFESNPLPIIMYSIEDLSIIDVNESAIRHYGYAKEEFLQMGVKDLRPEEEIGKTRSRWVVTLVPGDIKRKMERLSMLK